MAEVIIKGEANEAPQKVEEKTSKAVSKESLRAEAESLTRKYNEAIQSENFSEAKKLEDKIFTIINEYTAFARNQTFKEIAATDDPMLEAVKRLTFTTIRKRDEKVDGSDIMVRKIEETERPIDILGLHNYISGGIGKEKNWHHKIEKLNFLMTLRVCKELNIDPASVNNSYAMTKAASELDMGKSVVSNTALLKALQDIIKSMIGEEYKPLTHDVNYLNRVYTRKGKKSLSVACANHRYMRQYVMNICHRIVTNGSYDVEHPTQK